MNEKEKQEYLEEYKKEKEKGGTFFPDIVFKDAVVSLAIFIVLLTLAYFVGAPLEERADPSDTSYTPRPEWYFLFLFQLLKYFPGELEVIGVVVIPSLVILLLFVLPFLDRGKKRHPSKRKPIVIGTGIGIVGIIILTLLSIVEEPPPAEVSSGDQTAYLYTQNCAGCHGVASNIPKTGNLHEIIAEGNHAGMPPWGADLTNEQIDSLVGFILSPAGNTLFAEYCSECHQATELVDDTSLILKQALEQGKNFQQHADLDIEFITFPLNLDQRSSLLNFLVAPDGQRLFTTNCSSCHGSSLAVEGDREELLQTIRQGGRHLEMPAWGTRLEQGQLATLAYYVLDPSSTQEGESLYQEKCSQCHFDRIPKADSFEEAYDIISTGGVHETMPVWGNVLTDSQIEALADYALEASSGSSFLEGQQLYSDNCAVCHGDFGEGGVNPSRPGDIIAPISTGEYLQTRDDATLREIIAQGQPNFGMSPFGLSNGGPLDNTEIDAVVAYMRSWEADPPVEFPPEIQVDTITLSGAEIYQGICAQCHGVNAEGDIGPSLRSPEFRTRNTDDDIFTTISEGHEATTMISWGEILSSSQITQLIDFILQLPEIEEGEESEISFATVIRPYFSMYCQACHNDSFSGGGWNAMNYDDVINSGDNAPAVIPGDMENSLLAHKILGTQTEGQIMPPSQAMPEDVIQAILGWIEIGAPDN
jgi:mono/diheme cytochrome c family protein